MTKTPDEIKKGLEWDEVDESLRKIRFDDAGEVVEWKPKTSTDTKNGLLCCTIEGGCNDCPYQQDCFQTDGFSELAGDALALIQQLQDQNASLQSLMVAANAEIADLDTEVEELHARIPRWISVEERLPENDANVLVYAIGNNENSCIAMTSYTHNLHGFHIEGWRSPWQYFFHEHKITHWMPLPEPPKEST